MTAVASVGPVTVRFDYLVIHIGGWLVRPLIALLNVACRVTALHGAREIEARHMLHAARVVALASRQYAVRDHRLIFEIKQRLGLLRDR